MRIEEGKYYRTRDGRKVGPMVRHEYGWTSDAGFRIYGADGKRVLGFGGDEPEDLIAEWTDTGPIVIETVRRIKPGVYGRLWVAGERSGKIAVSVTSPNPEDNHMAWGLTAPELRELARVALEIAEYLENA